MAIRSRDLRGMTEDSDPVPGHRTWRSPALYVIDRHPRYGCGEGIWPVESRRSITPDSATKDPDLQAVLDGSDGTRTRDLRRDRPVMALPARTGIGGDFRREQGFPPLVLRRLPGTGGSLRQLPAGSARDALLSEESTAPDLRYCGRVLSFQKPEGGRGNECCDWWMRPRQSGECRVAVAGRLPMLVVCFATELTRTRIAVGRNRCAK
jgi:hypothetical protein